MKNNIRLDMTDSDDDTTDDDSEDEITATTEH